MVAYVHSCIHFSVSDQNRIKYNTTTGDGRRRLHLLLISDGVKRGTRKKCSEVVFMGVCFREYAIVLTHSFDITELHESASYRQS